LYLQGLQQVHNGHNQSREEERNIPMAQSEQDLKIAERERERIQALWIKAADRGTPPSEQATALALGFGVNFRLHLGEALIAAWETAKAVVTGTAAAHAPFAWWAWTETAAEVAAAAHAIFSSLVERMRPIDYITAVVLSAHPEGLTEAQLRKAVEDFLKDPKAAEYAWHLGMNASRVKRAKEVSGTSEWFSDAVKQLQKDDFLVRQGDTLTFKSRNFEVGWKFKA
jgi:hypothetical protein